MKVNMGDKVVEGARMDFAAVIETWNEYHLEDGTIIRMKTVLTRVVRTNEVNQHGSPVYAWNSTQVVDIQDGEQGRKAVAN